MKEKFKEVKLEGLMRVTYEDGSGAKNVWIDDQGKLLKKINQIVAKYMAQKIKMTNRQLYYKLVSENVIPNAVPIYKRLCVLLTDARYGGKLDWDAIEDRGRKPRKPPAFADINDLIKTVAKIYALNRWQDQDCYVEVWSEKDALSSVISPITDKFQVVFSVNKGYSSTSAMYDAARRFQKKKGLENLILYVGDHDPSGLDMIRDIRERLDIFGTKFGIDVRVEPIALTMEQIEEYSPPQNPAKFKDPRAKEYIRKFGKISWEVDALSPENLRKIIQKNILKYLDVSRFEGIKQKEKGSIGKILERFVKGDLE